MAEKTYPMTAEGKQKLQKQLDDLRLHKRPEVIKRIKIALGYGDLSENTEYSSAKNEQSLLEGKIQTIEHMLQYSKVVDNSDVSTDVVNVGKVVTFKDMKSGSTMKYEIVGQSEADPLKGKISNDSPIAKGLMGKKQGQTVDIKIPAGVMKAKIVKVEQLIR